MLCSRLRAAALAIPTIVETEPNELRLETVICTICRHENRRNARHADTKTEEAAETLVLRYKLTHD